MASAKSYTMDGTEGASVTLSNAVFDISLNARLVHQVAVSLMNAGRQGNAETKTRKEVRGGGAKPFRQKGTGRARQGSSREPQMRGGGVVFGPHKRSYRQRVPVKMKRKALCCVLSDRLRNDGLCVLEDLECDAHNTKTMVGLFRALSPEGRKTLLVTAQNEKDAVLSSRNIPRLTIRMAQDVNALDVLSAKRVIVLQDALGVLEERLT